MEQTEEKSIIDKLTQLIIRSEERVANINIMVGNLIKLTARYVQLEDKHEKMITEAYQTLQELARRPTTTNNNNNNLSDNL